MNRNRNSQVLAASVALIALFLLAACGSTPTPTSTPTAAPPPTATPAEPVGYGDHFSFHAPDTWRLVNEGSGNFSPVQSAILAQDGKINGSSGKVYEIGNIPPELFKYAAEMGVYLEWKGTTYSLYNQETGETTFPIVVEEVTLQ